MLRRTLFLCLLCCSLFWGPSARGQDSEDVKQLTTRVTDFFANLNDEVVGREKAFADLLAAGPLKSSADVKKLIDRVGTIEQTYGKFVEAERIDVREVGKDLILLKYLYKTSQYPIVWYFTYYRPPSTNVEANEWVIISVRFDTRLDLLGF